MSEPPSGLIYVAPVFRVADLARSLAYYRDRPGLQIEFTEAAEHLDACFGVQGVEALASRLASAGAVLSVPVYVRDPDG
jgi:hypothetical protein